MHTCMNVNGCTCGPGHVVVELPAAGVLDVRTLAFVHMRMCAVCVYVYVYLRWRTCNVPVFICNGRLSTDGCPWTAVTRRRPSMDGCPWTGILRTAAKTSFGHRSQFPGGL